MCHAFQMYVAYVSSRFCKSKSGVASVAWLYTCVASVCIKCFSCFRCMLQVFHLDVAYVAVAIHVCWNRVFQMFQLFSSGCCICCSGYTRILQVYVPNVSPILDVFCKYFIWMLLYIAVVIHICRKRAFQLFHLVSVCCNRCCSPRAAALHAPIQRYLSLSCRLALVIRCARNGRSVPKWSGTPWLKCMRACRAPERASIEWT
jgi:hypothetical protein